MKRLILGLILIAAPALAGGLFNEVQQTGACNSYLRMPSAKISNPYDRFPWIEMVTSRQYYGDACPTTEVFERRATINYLDFAENTYPLFDPNTGVQVGTTSAETLYAMVYSLWILGEKRAAGEVGTLYSDPATICYTTSGSDPICRK